MSVRAENEFKDFELLGPNPIDKLANAFSRPDIHAAIKANKRYIKTAPLDTKTPRTIATIALTTSRRNHIDDVAQYIQTHGEVAYVDNIISENRENSINSH